MLTSRADDFYIITWCAPYTRLYVRTQIVQSIAGTAATILLTDAFNVVQTTIGELHDGVITPGGFRWRNLNGLTLTIWNIGSSQMTWGQVGIAIQALHDSFSRVGSQGTARFFIYSGQSQIGGGLIATGPPTPGKL